MPVLNYCDQLFSARPEWAAVSEKPAGAKPLAGSGYVD